MIVRKLFDGVFSFERGPADILPSGGVQHHVEVLPQERAANSRAQAQQEPAPRNVGNQSPSTDI